MQPELPEQGIIGITKDISYIQRDIAEIKGAVKELGGVYITKLSVDDMMKAIDLRLKRLEASSNLWKWLGPTLSSAITAVLVFLLIQYISSLK